MLERFRIVSDEEFGRLEDTLSLFVLILYISNNLLIKSLPRCTFEFFNDMTATEVVLEVGSIVTVSYTHLDVYKRQEK